MDPIERDLLLKLSEQTGRLAERSAGVEQSLSNSTELVKALFDKLDEERKERTAADKVCDDAISQAKGGMKVGAWALGILGSLVLSVSSYQSITLAGLQKQAGENATNIENTAEIVKSIQVQGTPEGWEEVQKAALDSQQIIRDMKEAQDAMQADIEQLKGTAIRIEKKKAPAPVNKTVIVPAPQPYTFEKLVPKHPKVEPYRR